MDPEPRPVSTTLQYVLTLSALVLAAAGVAGAFLPGPGTWGIDHWSGMPRAVFAAGVLLVLFVALPWGRTTTVRAVAPLAKFLENRRTSRIAAMAVIGLFGAAFWFARERTFFLSDGELMIRAIQQNTVRAFEADLLSFRLQVWLHDLFQKIDPTRSWTASFRIASIGSGILWLAAIFAAVGRLTPRGWERFFLGGLMATLGFTRLFYGYVETSSLLAAASAIYLWRGIVFIETGRGLATLSIALLAAVSMHVTGLLLVPSYLFVVLRAAPGRARNLSLAWLALLFAGGAAFIMYRAGGPGPFVALYSRQYFADFLPLSGSTGPKQIYTLFSIRHWSDFLQQQLLLGPFAVVVLVALLVAIRRRTRAAGTATGPADGTVAARAAATRTIDGFLLLQVAAITLLSFLYGRELGAPRDWDLLAGAAPPAALLAGSMIIRAVPGRTALPRLAVLVLAVSLFHLVPWILVDAGAGRSVRRFEALLSHDMPLSRFARAYACEEVGRHHLERGRLREARTWFEEAVAVNPSDMKAIVPLARICNLLGDRDAAIRYNRDAVRIQPAAVTSHLDLAEALSAAGKPAEAVASYNEAIRLDPGPGAPWEGLGNACFAAGRFAEADSAWAAALVRTPGSADLWFNRGLAMESLGDVAAALQFYGKALSLDSGHRAATFAVGALYLRNGRAAESIPYFETCRALNPASADVAINLALARAFLGDAGAVTTVLGSVPGIDDRLVHAYGDAAMVLAGQGSRGDALLVLEACRARNPALARTNGIDEMMRRLGTKAR